MVVIGTWAEIETGTGAEFEVGIVAGAGLVAVEIGVRILWIVMRAVVDKPRYPDLMVSTCLIQIQTIFDQRNNLDLHPSESKSQMRKDIVIFIMCVERWKIGAIAPTSAHSESIACVKLRLEQGSQLYEFCNSGMCVSCRPFLPRMGHLLVIPKHHGTRTILREGVAQTAAASVWSLIRSIMKLAQSERVGRVADAPTSSTQIARSSPANACKSVYSTQP